MRYGKDVSDGGGWVTVPGALARMQSVRSADGTPIAFWRSGSGPPLLLIHGVVASHATTWRLVLPQLAQHFTVYAMDRRGRGASGDSATYALEREADDILAVVDTIDQAVDIVGHSFGGLCALEAALRTDGIRRLILYEAVPLRGADNYPPDVIPKLDALLAANQIETALVTMLREIVGMGDEDIDMLRRDPEAWATRLSNTRAMPRELRAEHEYVFLPERFTDLRVVTLLLVGQASAARELSSARGVAAALPSARVQLLPEQQHLAMYTAPDMFVRAVLEFLAEH